MYIRSYQFVVIPTADSIQWMWRYLELHNALSTSLEDCVLLHDSVVLPARTDTHNLSTQWFGDMFHLSAYQLEHRVLDREDEVSALKSCQVVQDNQGNDPS